MKAFKSWLARHLPEPPQVDHEAKQAARRGAEITQMQVRDSQEYVVKADRVASKIAKGISRNHIAPAFDRAYEIRGHRPS